MGILIIKRKAFFILTLLFFSLFLLGSFRYFNPDKPNVLFIMVDDLRPELGSFGAHHIISPHIDKLTKESLNFSQAYCNVPVCGASRASILSGVRPGKFRFLQANTYLKDHYPGVMTLPGILKKNGYLTIQYGKIYHHSNDDEASWDEIWRPEKNSAHDYVNEENIKLDQIPDKRGPAYEIGLKEGIYSDDKLNKKAIDKLRSLKGTKKPFFMSVGYAKPHLPFNAPKRFWDLYDSTKINVPPTYFRPQGIPNLAYHQSGELRNYTGVPTESIMPIPYAKKLIHGYYASVSYVDNLIGALLSELKTLGLDKNTIIVLIGDHGYNLGDHTIWNKHCTFNTAIRTPLILKIPGKSNGQFINDYVEFIDIFPTITDLAKIESPATLDGESVIHFLSGTRKKNFAISKWNNSLVLMKDGYSYTEWYDEHDEIKDRMLFEHRTDPLEVNNLANNPEMKEKINAYSLFIKNHKGKDYFVDRTLKKPNKN